jgi:UDP-glucose 4-epimerase
MIAIVVGCNGYIGQNLTLFLLSKGVELRCYDIHSDVAIKDKNIDYKKLDISDSKECSFVNWDVDVVYFLAGLTGTKASIEQADKFISTNDGGLNNVLSNITIQKASPRFIFPSTRLIYKGSSIELAEESEKEFKTVYALNKFSGEQLLNIYSSFYGLKFTIFRICVPYGNLGDIPFSYGTIGFMMKQSATGSITLFGDGNLRRTFTHIGHIVSILYIASSVQNTINDIYNIGGESFSLKEIADLIAEKDGSTINYVEWPHLDYLLESGDTVFNSQKIDNLLQLSYPYNFRKWLERI